MDIWLELSRLDSLLGTLNLELTLKRLSFGVCCLDHQSCNNCCLLSNLVLWRPNVLWKSSSAKSWPGFLLFTNKESCLLTPSQCFLLLCEWFLYPWFTPKSCFINYCGSKHSSWKSFNSHPSLVHWLILHCEVHSFSPKCFWTNLNPMSSVVAPFITENHESVFSMAWCTSAAALSVLQTEHAQGFHLLS